MIQRWRSHAEVAQPEERWSPEKQGRWGDEERRERGEETSRSGQWEEIRKKPEKGEHCKETRRPMKRELWEKAGEVLDRDTGGGRAGRQRGCTRLCGSGARFGVHLCG